MAGTVLFMFQSEGGDVQLKCMQQAWVGLGWGGFDRLCLGLSCL